MAELPDPLVSAEVDLRNFSYTPMYRGRLFGSGFNAKVSDSGWRAGVTLWLKSWDQVPAGTLPEDEVELCRLAELGRDLKTWRKLSKEALWGWFKCSDGRLHHKTVAEGVIEAWQSKQTQRDRTAKARATTLEKRQSQKPDVGTTKRATVSVTDPPTGSVTEQVTGSNRIEGKGRDVDNPESSESYDLERRCRQAVGEEPCLVSTDFGVILRLLDEPGITEADVLAGIAAGLAKADPGFRFKRWGHFDGWIRGAAKDRLQGKPRNSNGQHGAEKTVEIRGVQVPETVVRERADHWRKTGQWPWRDLWGPAPGELGSEIPKRFAAPEPVH